MMNRKQETGNWRTPDHPIPGVPFFISCFLFIVFHFVFGLLSSLCPLSLWFKLSQQILNDPAVVDDLHRPAFRRVELILRIDAEQSAQRRGEVFRAIGV